MSLVTPRELFNVRATRGGIVTDIGGGAGTGTLEIEGIIPPSKAVLLELSSGAPQHPSQERLGDCVFDVLPDA